MPEWLKVLYVCYLGKTKGTRLGSIIHFIKEHDGRKFFDIHSMPSDSVLDFLKKVDKLGYKL